jgi:transcriptional regulator with XRE-family HTH domain
MKNRVKEFREKAGLSQTELARRVHVASPNLSAVENNQRVAWPKLRRRLSRSLKTTEAELFPSEEQDGK